MSHARAMICKLLALLPLTGITCAATGSTAAPIAPPAFHAVAFVNDPLSHGTVGDALLSLQEAIRLHNGTLQLSQLSIAEQNQLSLLPGTGSSTDITWIELDAEYVDTITVQQDFDTIASTPFGLLLRGSGGMVTLDFGGAGPTRGLRATSNGLIVEGLRFLDAPDGLEVQMADATGQSGCTVLGCRFENVAAFGVRVIGTQANGIGRLIVEDCEFADVATAVVFDETMAGRDTIFEARDVFGSGLTDGFDLTVGTGGTARFTFDRVSVACSNRGIDLSAPASNGRATLVDGTHLRVRAPSGARIDSAVDAPTWVECSMWNLLAAPGGDALTLGSAGHLVYGYFHELRSSGDVAIATGGAPLPLELRNLRASDGAVTLTTSASQALTVTESRFVDCDVDSVGTGAVTFDGCSFEGGTVAAATTNGALLANGCYVQNAGAGLTQSAPLAQPQLGSLSASPDDVAPGASITFTADLPGGLVCGFALGFAPLTAPSLPPPLHVYLDPSQFVFLPGIYVGQQSTTWTAPAGPQFVGIDLIVQAIVLPYNGLSAPPLQLPPGWRFEIR